MSGTISAVYTGGVLRPLMPLQLPENTRVEVRIVKPRSAARDERQAVYHALRAAGVIGAQPTSMPLQIRSDEELAAAAKVLGDAGPLSELIIAERDGR